MITLTLVLQLNHHFLSTLGNKTDGGPQKKRAKADEEDALAKPSSVSGTTTATTGVNAAVAAAASGLLRSGPNPRKWSVPQVCDFVRNIPGCAEYVDDFVLQEIDGVALMLLKPDILMSSMQIKLGPALKICNAVDALQEEIKQN